MIPSCRSWLMRSRSSNIARRWTCSWSRAFSIAIPAWTANVSTRRPVILGELVRARLVGEVEVADGSALDRDRNAEEAVHRRMMRRKSVAPGIDRQIGIRNERFSRTMSPSRPCPLGNGPMRARVAASMPDVMNRSMTPSASTIPSAAYWAPTSGRTWLTITWRTSSTRLEPAIALVAVSKAPTTPTSAAVPRSHSSD